MQHSGVNDLRSLRLTGFSCWEFCFVMINIVFFFILLIAGIVSLAQGVSSRSIPLCVIATGAFFVMAAILFTGGITTTQLDSQTTTVIDKDITQVDVNYMVLNSSNDAGALFFAWLFLVGTFICLGITIAGAKASGLL